jgi:hypothetical protein
MENVSNNTLSYKKYFSDTFNLNTYSNNLANDIADNNNKLKEEYLINLEGLIKGIDFSLLNEIYSTNELGLNNK